LYFNISISFHFAKKMFLVYDVFDMKPRLIELKIEKTTESGEGLGYFEGMPILVFGVLVGELILAELFKKKAGVGKARILQILEPSQERIAPRDDHFESCGPWQMMPIGRQRELKKKLIQEYFQREIGFEWGGELILEVSDPDWGYRNKMEFSFAVDADNQLALALHKRGGHCGYYSLDHCALANDRINKAGQSIVAWLRLYNLTFRELKSLILRYSYHEDRVLADLFIKEKAVDLDLSVFKENIIAGMRIIYSDRRSPASVTTEVLNGFGAVYLTEKIGGLSFRFGPESFFQSNPPAFEKLIDYLRQNIDDDERLIDLYAGVGVIGFCLADRFKSVVSLEFNQEASAFARENVDLNDLKNVEIICGEAEKADLEKIIQAGDVLLVDPPRSGLHPKALKKILAAAPKTFVYVSCNPYTQARDLSVLREKYAVKSWRLFDFYPQTPHCESVMILSKIVSNMS